MGRRFLTMDTAALRRATVFAILFGGIATLIGMVLLGRLPRFTPSRTFDPRFTNDRFGVAVHCPPGRGPSVRDILQGAGAEEVRP